MVQLAPEKRRVLFAHVFSTTLSSSQVQAGLFAHVCFGVGGDEISSQEMEKMSKKSAKLSGRVLGGGGGNGVLTGDV